MTAPYYSDDLVTLYHGDSREHGDLWTTADVLITDPPYGRAWEQHDVYGAARNTASRGIANDKDTTVRDDVLTMWGDGRPTIMFGDLMLTPPAGTKLVGVYYKADPTAGMRGAIAGVRRDTEAVYFIGKWPTGLGGRTALFTTRRQITSANGIVAKAGGHPHTKGDDVMSDLIRLTTGTVADTFAGGGSTLLAAKHLGRPAVGFEVEERWCEQAARRLSQDILDLGALA